MPDDITAQIAQGIKPQPQQGPDLIGTISSLAQLQYAQANAQRAEQETQNLQLQGQGLQRLQAARQATAQAVQNGMDPADAIVKFGLNYYDPQGSDAALKNVQQQRDLLTNRTANPSDPNSYRLSGPNAVAQAAGAQKTQADTSEVQLKNQETRIAMLGSVANMMLADMSPAGRARASAAAHAIMDKHPELGMNPTMIDSVVRAPDDQYQTVARQLQARALQAQQYLETTGQAQANKSFAEGAFGVKTAGPTDQIIGGQNPGQYGFGLGGVTARGAPQFGSPTPQPVAVPQGAANAPSPGAQPMSGAAPQFMTAPPGAAPQVAPQSVSSPAAAKAAYTNPSLPIFQQAAATHPGGFSAEGLAKLVQFESSGNPYAISPTGAKGLTQFLDSTYKLYGQPGTSPLNPISNINAGAAYGVANARILAQALGRQPTDAELALAHNQDGTKAAKLLLNPNVRAGDIVGDTAIRVNGGNPNAPASAFTSMIMSRYDRQPTLGGIRGVPMGVQMGGQAGVLTPAVVPNAAPPPPIPDPNTGMLTQQPGAPPWTGSTAEQQSIANAEAKPAEAAAQAKELETAGNPQNAPAPAQAAAEAPLPSIADPTAGGTITGTAADQAQPLVKYTPGGIPIVGGITPGQMKEMEGRSEGYAKTATQLEAAATNANKQNAIFDQAKQEMLSWTPGPLAPHLNELRSYLLQTAKMAGVDQVDGVDIHKLADSVGDYEAFGKTMGQILRTTTRDVSPRPAFAELKMIQGQLAGPTNSTGGIRMMFNQFQGGNDYDKAMNVAANKWYARYKTLGPDNPKTGGQSFESFWNNIVSPDAFIMKRIHEETPETFNRIAAQMQATPQGRAAIAELRRQDAFLHNEGIGGF